MTIARTPVTHMCNEIINPVDNEFIKYWIFKVQFSLSQF